MKKIFFFVFLFIFGHSVHAQEGLYKEPYRPQYHFSPQKNWTNDPNGLLYYKGRYHLFFQYNPFGNKWGHMTWGHAVSTDLLHWKQLPEAIAEEKDTMIFSGSCVADINNTSGFGKKGQAPLVAVYTGHIEGKNQSQHIAYSLDEGNTWTKYNKNPVLDLHKKDFRDPKVFWYAPKKYWVMCVMLPVEHIVQFYSSPNLLTWNHLSDFGPAGDTSGVWECPDLVQVPVEGMKGKKKWLLQMSVGSGMQYFVGSFDGVRFTNENPADNIYRPDYGPDYYAAITYSNMPAAAAPVAVGWVNNWSYAQDIPTNPWRGAMSLPRTLGVKKKNEEWILVQQPVKQINTIRKKIYSTAGTIIEKWVDLPFSSQQYEIDLELLPNDSSVAGLRVNRNNDKFLEIGYDPYKKIFYVDRTTAGDQSFSKNFEKLSRFEIPYSLTAKLLRLQVFVDNSIAEVFVDGGERVFTVQLFPGESESEVDVFSDNIYSRIKSCVVYEMKSVW